jgi:3',5'-nucleoside bisphosphate phosphatase
LIDLHTHSVYSDGRATPAELIDRALTLRLRALAITDHNNGRGAREGWHIAQERGLLLIPGIEWYVSWSGYTGVIDMLGYGMDLWDASIRRMETDALVNLEEQIAEWCGYLTAEGYPITLNEVRAVNPRFAGHVQVEHALVRKGLITDKSEMTRLFNLTWARVHLSTPMDIATAIETIHRAGGVAIIAHAHQYKRNGVNWPLSDLAQLKALGLDGIEVYHRRMQGADRAHFLHIAQELGMLMTGGSDEHGWPTGLPHLGVEPIPDSILDGLLERTQGVQAR